MKVHRHFRTFWLSLAAVMTPLIGHAQQVVVDESTFVFDNQSSFLWNAIWFFGRMV